MLAYDADLELFRDNFKRFMNEHIAPQYDQWEREGIMPRAVWNQLGEMAFVCGCSRRIRWLRRTNLLFINVG